MPANQCVGSQARGEKGAKMRSVVRAQVPMASSCSSGAPGGLYEMGESEEQTDNPALPLSSLALPCLPFLVLAPHGPPGHGLPKGEVGVRAGVHHHHHHRAARPAMDRTAQHPSSRLGRGLTKRSRAGGMEEAAGVGGRRGGEA